MDAIDEAFGMALRNLRKDNSMTQESLAQLSNLDRTYISMMERGKRSASIKTLFALSDSLNVMPSEIIIKAEKILYKSKG